MLNLERASIRHVRREKEEVEKVKEFKTQSSMRAFQQTCFQPMTLLGRRLPVINLVIARCVRTTSTKHSKGFRDAALPGNKLKFGIELPGA